MLDGYYDMRMAMMDTKKGTTMSEQQLAALVELAAKCGFGKYGLGTVEEEIDHILALNGLRGVTIVEQALRDSGGNLDAFKAFVLAKTERPDALGKWWGMPHLRRVK